MTQTNQDDKPRSFKEIMEAKRRAVVESTKLSAQLDAPAVEAPAVEAKEPVLSFSERMALRKAQGQAKPAATPQQQEAAVASTSEAVKELAATVKETYWLRVTNGAFCSSTEGKPAGFGWKAISLDQYNSLVAASLPSRIEQEELDSSKAAPNPVAGAIKAPTTKGGTAEEILSNLRLEYLKARFTQDEADEEISAVKEILLKQPQLTKVIEESPVPLNAKQLLGVSYTLDKQSFVLTGAAGTGKTTAQAAVVDILDKEDAFGVHDFKYIGEAPSIAICAFTKVAVRNIQKAIRKNPRIEHYASHCMTIHSLLEYEPEVVTRETEDGGSKDVRVFMPKRNKANPLQITHLIVEEASMVGLDLWWNLFDALLPGVQIVFLGDINQLQPVFAKPILGYALIKLPVIELSRVYRQALDSPIIYNAHQVLIGKPIKTSACQKVSVIEGKEKVKVGQTRMGLALGTQFRKLYELGFYSPDEDMILLPWNKQAMGVKAINEVIASFLGASRDAIVYHVRTNRMQWYLAVDDKVLVDKRAGVVTKIADNPKYIGADPRPAGYYTRDGTPILGGGSTVDFSADVGSSKPVDLIDYTNFSMDDVEVDEGNRASSHIVTVKWDDTNSESELRTAGDFSESNFQFGYAMTVHKAQGSEWRKVFCAFHSEHMAFLSRELVYTALTRAREEFILFAKPDVVERACQKQEVKGNTLAAKIEYFNSGALLDKDLVPVEKPIDWVPFSTETNPALPTKKGSEYVL